MKGVELPITALIIIALGLLVLLGVVALWMGGWSGGSTGVNVEAAKAAACGVVMREEAGCSTTTPSTILLDGTEPGVPAFDVPGAADNLQMLCETFYGVTAGSASECRQVCGCAS